MLAGPLLLERQAERAFALGAGEVRSRRTSAGLGVEIGQRAGPIRLAAQALVLGARLSLRGSGYGSDRADQAWDVGLGAGARVLVGSPSLPGWTSGGGTGPVRERRRSRRGAGRWISPARGGARGGHRIRAALTRFSVRVGGLRELRMQVPRLSGSMVRPDALRPAVEACPPAEALVLDELYRRLAPSISRWAERLGGPDWI